MRARIDILGSVYSGVCIVRRLIGYTLIFLLQLLRPRASFAAENLALRCQLAMCKDAINRKNAPQPRFDQAFRMRWQILSKLHCG